LYISAGKKIYFRRLFFDESDILIMSHAIRHQSTDAEIEDLIKLINYHLPAPVNSTKYMFFKKFTNIVKIQNHYYCPTCIILLHFGNEGEKTLRKFVLHTERLYGPEYMKFNVHLLLHIPKAVKFFGTLWAWSTSYNRILRDMIYNSQLILHQVCKSYLRL